MPKETLKPDEINTLVGLLKKLEPGFLPLDIFMEFARIVVMPIIEFVPLRTGPDGQTEILLLEREPSDVLWPNMLHAPGTVVRATDTEKTMYLAFDRILNDELKGTSVSAPHYVGSILHESRRGVEHAQIYWVEVIGELKIGKFYPVSSLPINLIESQNNFIKEAVRSYETSRLNRS